VHDVGPPTRTVSLVLSHDGRALGVLPTFEAETPWWQDVEPISRRFPELAVLRLLEALHEPGTFAGGHLTYLVEAASPEPSPGLGARLVAWSGSLPDDPRRMPWAMPGGPARDLGWARQLGVDGACIQHRTWNLSAIWSISTTTSTTWLKCVPDFFSHEASILRVLADHPVPKLLGADGHRFLLEGLAGRDGFDASLEERLALIDVLLGLQLATVERTDELLALGVPDRRWGPLLSSIGDAVTRRAPDSVTLCRLVEGAEERVAEIEACGLPFVLVHGDAHAGNARVVP
jgi:hypothetical protein